MRTCLVTRARWGVAGSRAAIPHRRCSGGDEGRCVPLTLRAWCCPDREATRKPPTECLMIAAHGSGLPRVTRLPPHACWRSQILKPSEDRRAFSPRKHTCAPEHRGMSLRLASTSACASGMALSLRPSSSMALSLCPTSTPARASSVAASLPSGGAAAWGRPVEVVLSKISDEPVAAASLGQVQNSPNLGCSPQLAAQQPLP